MKQLIVLMACLMACGASFAQNFKKVSGKITDEKGIALPYAIVSLYQLPDTIQAKKVSSDLNGAFTFEQLTSGDYQLMVNIIGYKSSKGNKFSIVSSDVQLAPIKLSAISNQLKEVSVQAKKPFVEQRADKTIINVENSIVSAGGTALDVLEKAPGVSVDKQNEQIKLNNKNGVMVMIDGKPNLLSGADLTTMLSNMSSDQIGTIEIITNPSAKYDAAGNAGIINIKLKRNKNFGTNGSLSSNVSQGIVSGFPADLYRGGLNLNLNHRVQQWNVYGNGAFMRRASFNQIAVDRTTSANGLDSRFSQNFGRTNKGVGYAGKFGVDYYANPKTTFGLMIDANTVDARMGFLSQMYINELQGNVASSNTVSQISNSKAPANNLTANFNLRHDLNKEGANLSFDLDYSGFGSKKDEDFDTKHLNQNGQLDKTTILNNNSNTQIDVVATKADLSYPLSKTANLEAGLKSSYVTTNNDFIASQFLNETWVKDLGKSNNFLYKENINAIYLNLSKKWENWEVQAGLRAENTNSNGKSITDQKEVNRNYVSLFPTVFINQNLNKNNSIRYSFGRRVDRPNYQQLNPFAFYLDPYTIEYGNPYLKPMFTNNFEISYSYKNAFSISLNYSDARDLIVQITEQNDVTRMITLNKNNIGRSQNYTAALSFPLGVTKWWNMQNNVSTYFIKITDPNLLGAQFDKSNFAYNLNTSSSFKLPNNFSAELNFWLNSPSVFGQEQSTVPRYALNLGIQKSLLNKKLRLRANVEDVFLTNQFAGKIVYQNLNLHIQNRSTSRRAVISASYSFGNQNVKSARNRNTATDDIKSRAGSN